MHLHQEAEICHGHGYRRAISLLRSHHVGRLRQAITKLTKTVSILQEPLNFGDFRRTNIDTHTRKVTSYTERNSVERLSLHNQTS
jgi:hypothetical protein